MSLAGRDIGERVYRIVDPAPGPSRLTASTALSWRPDGQQVRIAAIKLDDHRFAQSGVGNLVAENDPSVRGAPLASGGPRSVHGLIPRESGAIGRAQNLHRSYGGIVTEDPVAAS